jgi:uncharacterized protein (TIGR02147 family)
VAFNQAESEEDKNEAFERVAASQRFRKARRLDRAFFNYLSHWYYPAIREMVARIDFREEPKWIAKQLIPQIKPAEAANCLELLLELGLLKRNGQGRLERGEASVATGHEVRGLAIRNYHRQMLERAADSITLVTSELRDISALTVCIEAETVAELKERFHDFHEVLLDRCDRDEKPTAVYQINLQLFPLTQVDSKEDSE